MPLVRIAAVGEVPPGTMLEVIAGGRELVLCHAAGAFYAIDNECPHRGAPLAHGALHGHAVVCPWHAWEFDCRTGAYDYDPEKRLRTYQVTVCGEEIFVDFDARTA